MRISEIQRKVYEMIASGENVEIDEDLVKELAMEDNAEDILVDSILQIFLLATLLGINLEAALRRKMQNTPQTCA